jgi:hypothetical protein
MQPAYALRSLMDFHGAILLVRIPVDCVEPAALEQVS